MVEEVENLAAELQLGPLGYIERFVGREIEVNDPGSSQARVNPGFIAERKGSGFREAACVEPLQLLDSAASRNALGTSRRVIWPDDAATQTKPWSTTSEVLREGVRSRRKGDWNATS